MISPGVASPSVPRSRLLPLTILIEHSFTVIVAVISQPFASV